MNARATMPPTNTRGGGVELALVQDMQITVNSSARMNAEISETIRAGVLGVVMQVLGLPAQVYFNKVPLSRPLGQNLSPPF